MKHSASGSLSGILSLLLLIALLNLPSSSQWSAQVSGTDYDLYSVYFINSSTGFLSSSKHLGGPFPWGGEVIRTTNGGNNWSQVLYDTMFRAKGFSFVNENTGYVVGGFYAQRGYVFKTTNSGLNWSDITPSFLETYLFNIKFPNSSTGYAGGIFGVIKTTNAGNSWSTVLTVLSPYPTWGKIYFNDINTGFYARDTGMVYKTTNGGLNWTSTQISLIPNFGDITFINNNTGFIVAGGGSIFKTTNQGASWLAISSGVSQNLFSIFFTDENTGYLTSELTVLKTTTSGSIWFSVFGQPEDTLFGSYFINSETGYVCGDAGRVYKTTTGGVLGITPISNEIPKQFMLYQNYPNPFNPNTNIKFAIAKASNVKLTVFDMLGREVETLVNEYVSPGLYQVKCDASGFSSGIYFYKIITNEFSSVKKMSVVK